jgi:threonine dehydratase
MLPEFKDIEKAARRIEGFAVLTPVIESPKLNAISGGRVLIKAECLQRTGSFKFRGAWNMISKLDAKKAKGGVVAYSSATMRRGLRRPPRSRACLR